MKPTWIGAPITPDASPGSHSIVDGGSCNLEFGEELLGGLDYDGDGNADLFVGDIVGGDHHDLRGGPATSPRIRRCTETSTATAAAT